jgi:O-antigen ligase
VSIHRLAYWAVLAFILTLPVEGTLTIPLFGRASQAMGFVLAVIWIVAVTRRGGLRRFHVFHGVLALFLLWSGLTLFWSVDPQISMKGFITQAQILGMVVIIWDVLRTRTQVEAALQAYVVGAYLAAAGIISDFLTSPAPEYAAHHRYTLGTFEVDGIALILALGIPAAWYLAIHQGRWQQGFWTRLGNFAYLPVAAFAMALTGTRGAAVASIPSAVFVIWSIWRSTGRTRIIAGTAIGVAVGLVVALAPPELLGRIGSAADNLTAAGERSETIWTRSFQVFHENPITGVGLDVHRQAVPIGFHITEGVAHSSFGKEAHNTLISILVETGLVGLLLFGGAAFVLFREIARLRGPDARYWICQLAVIAIDSQTLSLEDSKTVWFFLALAVTAAIAKVPRALPASPEASRPAGTRLRSSGVPATPRLIPSRLSQKTY